MSPRTPPATSGTSPDTDRLTGPAGQPGADEPAIGRNGPVGGSSSCYVPARERGWAFR